MYYYLSQPPYFVLFAGFFAALTCGAAFAGTLKLIVQRWLSDRAKVNNLRMQTGRLLVPFLGMTVGVCFFLSSGLEIFGFTSWLAYVVAVPMTILLSLLVWLQLGSMLSLIERKGFQAALDIDSWQ
ncbi:MAG: hypothetical protein JOZ78_02690 [Chroococcidiopsidaceae cyanobacterium CP_BM_ER_R8_30]|nr:hypothetical protein [Chroococcidiopsidaceae cyanobacterium CP_BM_ER_R8_30]